MHADNQLIIVYCWCSGDLYSTKILKSVFFIYEVTVQAITLNSFHFHSDLGVSNESLDWNNT